MLVLACLLLGLLPLASATAQERWTGNYVVEHEGVEGELSLLQVGSRLGGTYTVNGEQFTVQGRVDGTTAAGTVLDAYFQQAPFEAQLHARGVVVRLRITDESGRVVPVTLNFEKPELAAQRRAAAAAAHGGAGGAGSGGDRRVVGAWRATEAGASGGFTWASDRHFTFRADGTCVDGGGEMAAGGWESGRSAASACEWRTENGVMYLRRGSGWNAVARYGVTDDGSTMMWTYGNGDKRFWERQ